MALFDHTAERLATGPTLALAAERADEVTGLLNRYDPAVKAAATTSCSATACCCTAQSRSPLSVLPVPGCPRVPSPPTAPASCPRPSGLTGPRTGPARRPAAHPRACGPARRHRPRQPPIGCHQPAGRCVRSAPSTARRSHQRAAALRERHPVRRGQPGPAGVLLPAHRGEPPVLGHLLAAAAGPQPGRAASSRHRRPPRPGTLPMGTVQQPPGRPSQRSSVPRRRPGRVRPGPPHQRRHHRLIRLPHRPAPGPAPPTAS